MNLTKTDVLAQHTVQQSETQRMYIDSGELPVTERFTYLGSIITLSFSMNEEVSCRICMASSVFSRLTHCVFGNHKLNLVTKRSVYQAICISILLFGCKAWSLYRRQFRKFKSFHGNCLQRILGVKWYHQVPRVES